MRYLEIAGEIVAVLGFWALCALVVYFDWGPLDRWRMRVFRREDDRFKIQRWYVEQLEKKR